MEDVDSMVSSQETEMAWASGDGTTKMEGEAAVPRPHLLRVCSGCVRSAH